jgi:predicted DNA-binding protein
MAELSKRATVYFDPEIHRVLKVKAAETSTSISYIINEVIRRELLEDEEDLREFNERISEPTLSYEKLVADLNRDGKI